MARRVAPVITRVCQVQRVRALDGQALHLMIHGLGRKTRFAAFHEVPAFEGDIAWFETTSKAKTPLGVAFVRQVDKPTRPLHWLG